MRTEVDTPAPRPVASSVNELLRGASHREPFVNSDSKSGSAFERVVIDGVPHVVKHVHPDQDWTMRFNDDIRCNPVRVWASGLMDSAPDRIDHATVGVAGGLGRNGSGGAILMRDVAAELVPSGDTPLHGCAQSAHLDAMAGLSARMLGWRDTIGLVPLTTRWSWFGPRCLAAEAALGWPDLVPRIAAEGWERFTERAARDARDVIADLRRDPTPLVAAVSSTPMTFVHGDWKLGNVGTASDGRTILIDWTYPGEAPPCHELAWYLALNSARLCSTKEETILQFRTALERHGVNTTGWYERQTALCLLAAVVIFGWEKALGTERELRWWCERAVAGAVYL